MRQSRTGRFGEPEPMPRGKRPPLLGVLVGVAVTAGASGLGACESEVLSTPGPFRPRFDTPVSEYAVQMYALQVGARWTFLRSGDVLRWKEITGCEDVLIVDGDSGERHNVRAYVRENRSVRGTTSVHYLIATETGVYRVRRDDVDTGNLTMFATYYPPGPRLLDGPYRAGATSEFAQRAFEFSPRTLQPTGGSDMSAVDTVLGEEMLAVAAGDFLTVGVERQWISNNAHKVRSFYATGVGEIREETTWPNEPLPRLQIEELVAHAAGYGSCTNGDGSERLEHRTCEQPLAVCFDAWGSGNRGCTDLRVDPDNCGACGRRCDSGVCAGSVCQVPACDASCAGATICCPMAWNWATPGCTNPSRDRWNCGGCGLICGPDLVCEQGECVCAEGSRDCAGTGTCQSVLHDPNNCGECQHRCEGATPICDLGVCVATCLSVDLADCGGKCVDLAWNDDHCGRCGHRCGDGTGTVACNQGTCVTCDVAGLTDCGGDCVDLAWSEKHCGQCNQECANGSLCVFNTCIAGDGTCANPCTEPDQICCEGTCIDPKTNDRHCGGCGVDQCESGCTEACRGGLCTPVDCGGGDD